MSTRQPEVVAMNWPNPAGAAPRRAEPPQHLDLHQVPVLDDEKTQSQAGYRGQFVTSRRRLGHTLTEGTVVGGLEIIGVIGEGGFGIVYLANDPALRRQVAVKEYMPSSLAVRAKSGLEVTVKSDRHLDAFHAGLRSFVNEARLLARFDHRSLVKVYAFWEAHGTAYMAMPYYEGPTLKRALSEMGRPPDEIMLRGWLNPILDALVVMHAEHCFHRDIAPDNILLTAGGPLLLDFGASRRVIGDMTHALTSILKPGYAPIEQYGEMSVMSQGAWTDLYALACVAYCAITGSTPTTAIDRLMSERVAPLSELAAGRYSAAFLAAIDAAMAVLPQHRPQDVAQFRALLDAAPVAGVDLAIGPVAAQDRAAPSAVTPAVAADVPVEVAWPEPQAPTTAAPNSRGARRRRVVPVLAAAAALAAAGAIALAVHQPSAQPGELAAAPLTQTAQAPVPLLTDTLAPSGDGDGDGAGAGAGARAPTATPDAVVAGPPAPADGTPSGAAVGTAAGTAPALREVAASVQAERVSDAPPRASPPVAKRAVASVEPRRPARVVPNRAQEPMPTDRAARCSDILQKASLETLSADETTYLRERCR